MSKFGLVITGTVKLGVDIDEFRNRLVVALEGLLLPDPAMTLNGIQFREFKTKEANDVPSADGSVPGC